MEASELTIIIPAHWTAWASPAGPNSARAVSSFNLSQTPGVPAKTNSRAAGSHSTISAF
jgi:hypothetical protein